MSEAGTKNAVTTAPSQSPELIRSGANGTRVRTIPASVRRFAPTQALTSRKRVAAYARVSTDEAEQLTSYEAQVEHYTRYIRSNPEWEFVEVYADEGISGTNTKKRVNFNRMIADALAGKIDTIITKSISRFARNTVDTLTTIRQLKSRGIGVIFEKENIDTLDSKGELLITIMSSLAQEESRSISENVTWGWRNRLAEGKVSVAYGRFLGYEKGPDGNMTIVEKEAEIVRRIYAMFLDGKTPSRIASALTKEGIPSPGGKTKWRFSTVKSILTNEKYKGDSLQQKTFTVDFLNKIVKVNEGEVPQYYVENSHPAIVSAEVFDLVQAEMSKRQRQGRHTSSGSIFSNRLVCGDCGAFFGSKVWHSNDPYRCVVWRCNKKYEKEKSGGWGNNQAAGENPPRCQTPHLREEEIKTAFVAAINKLISNKEELLSAYSAIITELMDTDSLQRELERLGAERERVYRRVKALIYSNATKALDQAQYEKQYQEQVDKDAALQKRIHALEQKMKDKSERLTRIEAFAKELEAADLLTDFDESLFAGTVERIIVRQGKRLTFLFKDGTEMEA